MAIDLTDTKFKSLAKQRWLETMAIENEKKKAFRK
jgi:hypothetical protein